MGMGLWSCSSAEEEGKQRQSFRGKPGLGAGSWLGLVALCEAQEVATSPSPKGNPFSELWEELRALSPLAAPKGFPLLSPPLKHKTPSLGASWGAVPWFCPPWSDLLRDVWQGLVRASYIQPLVIPSIPSWLIPTNDVGGISSLFSQQENPMADLL